MRNPDVLYSMGLLRIGHDLATEQQQIYRVCPLSSFQGEYSIFITENTVSKVYCHELCTDIISCSPLFSE